MRFSLVHRSAQSLNPCPYRFDLMVSRLHPFCCKSGLIVLPPLPSQQESKIIDEKLTKELVCVEGYQSFWAISR